MLSIGSLFSGIGGLELGLEWAGLGPVQWQVEINPFCRQVLAKHWPEVRRFEDVCRVGVKNLAPVDLICGGFPCQDVSSAGARRGLAGERSGLWSEYARVVAELRPAWVVVENVTSGAALWVDAVRDALGERGYATLPIPLRADALGAPYPRPRTFIVGRCVANDDRDVQSTIALDAEVASPPSTVGVATNTREAANADGEQLQKQPRGRCRSRRQGAPFAPLNRWREPMPEVGGMVPGATDGLARRAGGNCVVPQCAEVIGWVIRELMNG